MVVIYDRLPSVPDVSLSQIVVVVGWFMVASFVITTCIRLGTKLSMKRLLGIDDGLITLAMVFGIGQMIMTFVLALLAKTETSAGSRWGKFQKAFFASQLLFIPTVCTAKLSILHSLHQLTPVREQKTVIAGFGLLISVSMVAFEFAAGLQCSQDRWRILSGKCFDQTLFWQAFGALDIITDVFVALFPTYIVCNLQMNGKFKIVIASIFGTRILTIVASAMRLIYLSRSHANINLSSSAFWTFILTTEIEQGLSIMTACIPFLKPFFEALETGMLAPTYGLATVMKLSAGSRDRSNRSERSGHSESATELSTRGFGTPGDIGGIQVSRRISTHSERWEWEKDGGRAWAHAVAEARSRV